MAGRRSMQASIAGLVIVAAFAQRSVASEVDLSSPKSAVKSMYRAILENDDDALRQCVVDDPAQQQAALALANFTRTIVGIEQASQDRYHTTLRSEGNPKVTLNIPDLSAVDYAHVDSDGQFATVRVEHVEEPYRVKHVGNGWRVDMTDDKVRTAQDLQGMVQVMGRLQQTLDVLRHRIEQGDLENVGAARNEFVWRMVHAVLYGTTQPSEQARITAEPTSQPTSRK